MNSITRTEMPDASIMEAVLAEGDLGRLTSEQRVAYYHAVCNSLGLNPLTRPFDYIRLNGKLVLYAKRDATDQKRNNEGISVQITDRRIEDDLYIVTARATTATGRSDEDFGAVSVAGLKGEARANAMLKAVTKAKRRVTLSICGMGFSDESEVEGLQGAFIEHNTSTTRQISLSQPSPEPAPDDTMPTLDEPAYDKVAAAVDRLVAKIMALETEDAMHGLAGDPKIGDYRAKLAKDRPDLENRIAAAFGDRYQELIQPRLDAEQPAAE